MELFLQISMQFFQLKHIYWDFSLSKTQMTIEAIVCYIEAIFLFLFKLSNYSTIYDYYDMMVHKVLLGFTF